MVFMCGLENVVEWVKKSVTNPETARYDLLLNEDEIIPANSDYAQSKEEAQVHLERVRQRVLEVERVTDILGIDAMLKELGESQYSHTSRFVFELLQNADDSSYGSRLPSVSIQYCHPYFLFESNELGFRNHDVTSLCSASRSSKVKNGTKPGNSIGEKGIGFKSVFGVSRTVWIKSGFYSFYFTKDVSLGRILPHWGDFPKESNLTGSAGHTSILLKIEGEEQPELTETLRKLEPRMLLFLRKLGEITIKFIERKPGWLLTKPKLSDLLTSTLKVDKIPNKVGELHTVKIYKSSGLQLLPGFENELAFRYLVLARNLPEHPLRKGDSEIIIVLPQDPENTKARDVYAYLPIRNYGFKFCIQANFILVSSREDIQDNAYNKALAGEIPLALLYAIKCIVERGNNVSTGISSSYETLLDHEKLEYEWPLLLPLNNIRQGWFHEIMQGPFKDLRFKIVNLFAKHKIFRDFEGKLFFPRELTCIPDKFKTNEGVSFLPLDSFNPRPISTKYPPSTLSTLFLLGVNNLSAEDFLLQLETLLSKTPSFFQDKPIIWRNQLCGLLSSLTEVDSHTKIIKRLKIVPTRQPGQWISFDCGFNPFFAERDMVPYFPAGVQNMIQIDPNIIKENLKDQEKLFRKLGASTHSVESLCKLIHKYHQSIDLPVPPSLSSFGTIENAVLHIQFYYAAKNASLKEQTAQALGLWCVTEAQSIRKLSDVYMHSADPYSATIISTQTPLKIDFLHPKYIKTLGGNNAVVLWLQETMGVSKILRIVQNPTAKDIRQFEPHPDLKALAKNHGGVLLRVLMHHWHLYSPWFSQMNNSKPDIPTKLIEVVMNMTVRCHGGGRAKLRDTYLPRKELLELSNIWACACEKSRDSCSTCRLVDSLKKSHSSQPTLGTIPSSKFLELDEASDHRWNFLKLFGVSIAPDLKVYLFHLRSLQSQNIPHSTADRLYKRIYEQNFPRENWSTTREFFDEGAPIYIPSKPGESYGSWHPYGHCIWDAKIALKHVPKLKSYYPGQEGLFCRTLDKKKLNLEILLREANGLTVKDGIEHITSILENISTQLKHESGTTLLKNALINSKMFPIIPIIHKTQPEPTDESYEDSKDFTLVPAFESYDWYIPDKADISDAFQGLIPMSKLSARFVDDYIPVLRDVLGLSSRFLSNCVAKPSIQTINKDGDLSRSVENFFRERALYISALVKDAQKRRNVLLRLNSIEAVGCERLSISWRMKGSGINPESGTKEVKFAVDYGPKMVLYVTRQGMGAQSAQPELWRMFSDLCEIHDSSDYTILIQILSSRTQEAKVTIRRYLGHHSFLRLEREYKDMLAEKSSTEVTSLESETLPDFYENKIVEQERLEEQKQPEPVGNATSAPTRDAEERPQIQPEDRKAKKRRRVKQEIVNSFGEESESSETGETSDSDTPPSTPESNTKTDDTIARPNTPIPRIQVENEAQDGQEQPTKQPRKKSSSLKPQSSSVFKETDDRRDFGELQVSQYLETLLGRGVYKANEHWTSPVRSRHGHTTYTGPTSASTFTISETDGELTKMVQQAEGIDPGTIETPCEFHIQVVATYRGHLKPFYLPPAEIEKARKMTIRKGEKISKVYILARVSNVGGDYGIYLYLDPWKLYADGSLSLQAKRPSRGVFSESAATLVAHDSAKCRLAPLVRDIYKKHFIQLDQIRLLRLNLDPFARIFKGAFEITDLSSSVEFCAISYCWGRRPDPTNCSYFETDDGSIAIGDSLTACLRCLQNERISELIWADAICIDQDEHMEKARQVRRMGSLYSKAKRVIVWLGTESPKDDRAIEILNRLQRSAGDERNTVEDSEVKQIEALLAREWFGRMWIIQELVLGSHVIVKCGSSEIEWNDFMRGIAECERVRSRSKQEESKKAESSLKGSHRAYALDRTRTLRKLEEPRLYNFLKLRRMFLPNRSSRPRDKLFSLRHLAFDTMQGTDDFNPDYDSPDECVLYNFVAWMARFTPIPKLLYWAGHAKSAKNCSWMPDMMGEGGPDYYRFPESISEWRTVRKKFSTGNALTNERNSVVIANRPQPTLRISGIIYDKIRECSILQAEHGVDHFYPVMEIFKTYMSRIAVYPASEDCSKAEIVIKTLIGDAPGPLTVSTRPYFDNPKPSDKWERGFVKEIFAIESAQIALNPLQIKLLSEFWATAVTFLRKFPQPRICLTEKGYIGIVPAANPEDVIFLMKDATIPFVLKKQSEVYKLVGEAYIHGLMYSTECTPKIFGLKTESIALV